MSERGWLGMSRARLIALGISGAIGVAAVTTERLAMLVGTTILVVAAVPMGEVALVDRASRFVSFYSRSRWTRLGATVEGDHVNVVARGRARAQVALVEPIGRLDLAGADESLALSLGEFVERVAAAGGAPVAWRAEWVDGRLGLLVVRSSSVAFPNEASPLDPANAGIRVLGPLRPGWVYESPTHIRIEGCVVRLLAARGPIANVAAAASLVDADVSVTYSSTVIDGHRASRLSARHAQGDHVDASFASRLGFRGSAVRHATSSRIAVRESDVAAGRALLRHSVLVTIVAQDLAKLERRTHEVRRRALSEGVTLETLVARQAPALRAAVGVHGALADAPWTTSAEIAAHPPRLGDAGTTLTGSPLGHCRRGPTFSFDTFDAYRAGIVTNPNVLVTGAIGTGKSTLVKMLARRAIERGDRVVVVDPKGEYAALARLVGGRVIEPRAGSTLSISPFGGTRAEDVSLAEAALAITLGRPLVDHERLVLAETVARLADEDARRPLRALVERLHPHLGSRRSSPERTIALAARRLVDGDLAGVIDVEDDLPVDEPLVVIDLSASWASDRFALSALAASAAARRMLLGPGAGHLVLDEAWAMVSDEATSSWLSGSWKLARATATSHVVVLHRWSDAFAAAPEGSARRARVVGLLRDCDTAFVLRQDRDEVALLDRVLGFTPRERHAVTRLGRGAVLARYGAHRSIVDLAPDSFDATYVDTDAAMRASV
jgi:energy-coupling factor transporter ATP-binding protein EcfA2